MEAIDVIKQMLGDRINYQPKQSAEVFAPINIALCKYWGKRDVDLNLPFTDSLSITLPHLGTTTRISLADNQGDTIVFNGTVMDLQSVFAKRVFNFLNLFKGLNDKKILIETNNNVPTGSGLASSASGFAALTLALNQLFEWQLSEKELSILARLGSGSASRSVFDKGFVHWHAGMVNDGMDSFAERLHDEWPNLCVGILTVSNKEKPISSREAMQQTVKTSSLYEAWPNKVEHDIKALYQAIKHQDFSLLGETAESNALTMHATMLSAWPPVSYWLPDTIIAMQQVWQLRKAGVEVYFTEDAGPNLKLLFLKENEKIVQKAFPEIQLVSFK